MSLEEKDRIAGAVAKAPRVSLADIEASIEGKFVFNGQELSKIHPVSHHAMEALKTVTFAVIVQKNGHCVLGISAPASPENYKPEVGEQFAYQHAISQLWPVMGYALRDRLAREKDQQNV